MVNKDDVRRDDERVDEEYVGESFPSDVGDIDNNCIDVDIEFGVNTRSQSINISNKRTTPGREKVSETASATTYNESVYNE